MQSINRSLSLNPFPLKALAIKCTSKCTSDSLKQHGLDYIQLHILFQRVVYYTSPCMAWLYRAVDSCPLCLMLVGCYICFEVEYFYLEPSLICFAYYSTWIPQLQYSPQRRISKRDPALPKFGLYGLLISSRLTRPKMFTNLKLFNQSELILTHQKSSIDS